MNAYKSGRYTPTFVHFYLVKPATCDEQELTFHMNMGPWIVLAYLAHVGWQTPFS